MYQPNTYVATVGQTEFDVTFSYRARASVQVLVDDVEVEFSWVSATRIALDVAATGGETVVIQRVTDIDTPEVTFEDTSVVLKEDLNAAARQALDRLQEINPLVLDSVRVDGGVVLTPDPGRILGWSDDGSLENQPPPDYEAILSAVDDAETAASEAAAVLEDAAMKSDIAVFLPASAYGGIVDSRDTLAAVDAIAQLQGRAIQIGGSLRVASDIVLSSPVNFIEGGKLVPDAGVVIQLQGPFNAGLSQVFDLSAGGGAKVVLPDQMGEVWAAWWGLSVDRDDNEVPVQQAITALEGFYGDGDTSLSFAGGTVRLHRGVFPVSGPILMRNLVRLRGIAREYSRLAANAATWGGASRMVRCALWDVQAVVTGITQATPAVVTAPSHGFSNGDVVTFEDVGGMTDVNDVQYTIANVTTDTFSLKVAGTSTDVDSSAYGAFTSGGTASRYRSQFSVRCEELALNAGNISAITEVVQAESWNEQCGLTRCLINNFQRTGVKIRRGYGGSAVTVIEDCEIMGNNVALSIGIDADVSIGFTSTYHDVVLARVTVTGCKTSVAAYNKIRIVPTELCTEDADIGIFLSGAARVAGGAYKAQRATVICIGLDTNWSPAAGGRIDGLSVVEGPATNLLVDYRAGKSGYTPFKGGFLSGPLSYPFRGKALFGGFIVAGTTPPTPDTDTLLSSVTRPAIGQYRCTLATGFNLANKANYSGKAWVPGAPDATAHTGLIAEVVPITGTIFDIRVINASTLAATNADNLAFEIYHKP